MKENWRLSPNRILKPEEVQMVWQKPESHIVSDIERRVTKAVYQQWQNPEMKLTNILLEGDAGTGKTQIAKALSANFGLPYTKVTCFADMDKSDILGSILPLIDDDNNELPSTNVSYAYYPSEIVRAYENGWLLEIQEPTVIRDASVLMALNSALELDGSLNLPTKTIKRHPDFMVVITTNRGYNGCRPLNEALRDRVQHSEKMDLPEVKIMVSRALAKTDLKDEALLTLMAETIQLLDQTARANAIKGVAGMRYYLYWAQAVAFGEAVKESLYQKVLYKISTDSEDLMLLEKALIHSGKFQALEALFEEAMSLGKRQSDTLEIQMDTDGHFESSQVINEEEAVKLVKTSDSKGASDASVDSQALTTQSQENSNDGSAFYHELEKSEDEVLVEKSFRKALNQEARELQKTTSHADVKMIIHRPQPEREDVDAYIALKNELNQVISTLKRQSQSVLSYEIKSVMEKGKRFGQQFNPQKIAYNDFMVFNRKGEPSEKPSLAVGLRIDESASMATFGRIEAARLTALALYEFCLNSDIPIWIYGDTADKSRLEQMSIRAYVDPESSDKGQKYSLMQMKGRSNNRDGLALAVLASRLEKSSAQYKLIISISDGQPKALPDYGGAFANEDVKQVIKAYNRKGIQFVAAAIGQDQDMIAELYGRDNTLKIDDPKQLAVQLIRLIARHLQA